MIFKIVISKKEFQIKNELEFECNEEGEKVVQKRQTDSR